MSRTSPSSVFTASLLFGLTILLFVYLADLKASLPPPVHFATRRLLQERATSTTPLTPTKLSSGPAAPLRPPPASSSPPTATAPLAATADHAASQPASAKPAAAADAATSPDSKAAPAGAAPNGTEPSTVDHANPAPQHWMFPWKAFWRITAFLCTGFGGLGLVIGLFAATLQGFGLLPTNEPCEPASGPKTKTAGLPSSYNGSRMDRYRSHDSDTYGHRCGEALAICGCVFCLLFLAVGLYLLMPAAAAVLSYGIGYVLAAALCTAVLLVCPCTAACRARRGQWREVWTWRAVALQARSSPPAAAAAAPAVELPSAKVTSDATDAGCKVGGEHDMHSVDLEAVVAPPQPQQGVL